MIRIPLTKGYTAIVDDEDARFADVSWWAMIKPSGVVYARRDAPKAGGGRQARLLHREVMGMLPGDGQMVDHINGDGLDCRRANLRLATNQENQRNIGGGRPHNSTGFLGVSLREGKWAARIKIDGKELWLGWFETAEQANIVRLAREQEVWGIQPRRRAAFEAAGLCRQPAGGEVMTNREIYRCDLFGIENHVGTVWSPRTFETAEEAQTYLDAQRAECKRRWNMDLSKHRVAPVKVTIKLATNGE